MNDYRNDYVIALEAVLEASRVFANRPFGDGYANPNLRAAVEHADALRQPVSAPTLAAILAYAPEEESP